MGASASLLILTLHRNGQLKGKSLLLIDQEQKVRRDKTFCFWSTEEETITKQLKSIISHSWRKVDLGNGTTKSLYPYIYNHVSSLDLYNEVQSVLATIDHDRVLAKIDSVSHQDGVGYVNVKNEKYQAAQIFDSRTPNYFLPQKNETHIYQSFVGWIIEFEDTLIDADSFRFMDFDVPQNDSTQFVYVLPYSKSTALVEATRFGLEKLTRDEAEVILKQYINHHFGRFKILEVELGCIPMSNAQMEVEVLPNVSNLGARNNNIKASTGYAFKNMFYEAERLSVALQHNDFPKALDKTQTQSSNGKFGFYDGLLLSILKSQPQVGKRIFTKLLSNVEIPKILKFLDEKTSLKEDIFLFTKLPWKPFLVALSKKIWQYTLVRPAILLMITLILFAMNNIAVLQSVVGYGLLVVGMLAVGLPHGAVDHLLETGNWNFSKMPKFIFKYLLISGLMGLVWYFAPQVALGVFLLYSSWHFGQADGKPWGLSSLMSLLWGLSLLGYVLGTHYNETNSIIVSIANINMPFACPNWSLLIWLLVAWQKRNLGFAITILWLTLSSFLPLAIAFGIYFVGQHSINGWIKIKLHLQLSNQRLWLHALPFHGAAWLILVLFYLIQAYSLPYGLSEFSSWSIFIIFISCLSLPHSIEMHSLYGKR